MFSWGYDAMDQDDLVKRLLSLFANREEFPALEKVSMCETMDNKKSRNKRRRQYANLEIELILSDR